MRPVTFFKKPPQAKSEDFNFCNRHAENVLIFGDVQNGIDQIISVWEKLYIDSFIRNKIYLIH